MKNRLKYIYLSIVATLIFVFTFTLINTKTYAYTYNENTDTITSDNLISTTDYTIGGNAYNATITIIKQLIIDTTYTISYDSAISSNLVLTNATLVSASGYISRTSIVFTPTSNNVVITFSGGSTSNNLRDKLNNMTWYMLNYGNFALPYEPYGKYINENVYNDLQQNYNDLQEQYNTLQNNYEYTIEQLNETQELLDTITERYNNLQEDYEELETQYNTLQNQYNSLQNQYNILQVIYSSLLQSYNELNYGALYENLNGTIAELYNDTYTNLNDFNNNTPIGAEQITWQTNNIAYKSTYIPNITDMIINNNNGTITSNNPTLLLTFKNPTNINNLSFTRTDASSDRYITLYFNDNTNEQIIIPASGSDRYNILWENTSNKYITNISIICETYFDIVNTITPNDTALAYQQGYIKGSEDTEQYLTQEYNNIQNQYNTLQTQYNTLRTSYNELTQRYNELQENDNSLYNMVIAIADTPITIFKQIFNFNVLGINITEIVTLIVSLLIIIWLIKKLL